MCERKTILVLGGARSGKSRFAEKMAAEQERPVLYVATALPIDADMEDRIKKHQQSRPETWMTEERYRNMGELEQIMAYKKAPTVLLDCATVMITNLMFDASPDYDGMKPEAVQKIEDSISEEFKVLFDRAEADGKVLIIVSNEVGLGLVPAYKLGNYFRDIAGRVNQMMASRADEVYFLISGIPMRIK
jgi:adenosylcobinamide kinase/adenosylcobinamide-phosphate guanylyltransferase